MYELPREYVDSRGGLLDIDSVELGEEIDGKELEPEDDEGPWQDPDRHDELKESSAPEPFHPRIVRSRRPADHGPMLDSQQNCAFYSLCLVI